MSGRMPIWQSHVQLGPRKTDHLFTCIPAESPSLGAIGQLASADRRVHFTAKLAAAEYIRYCIWPLGHFGDVIVRCYLLRAELSAAGHY